MSIRSILYQGTSFIDFLCQCFDKELSAFASDASRFVKNFHTPISESAPHIYLLALSFLPSESRISKYFLLHFLHWLAVTTGLKNDWSFLPHVWTGHADAMWSVALLLDGKYVVSGSADRTIQIWDINTGKTVSDPFKGHTDIVCSVTFLPNGKHVVFGSVNTTIQIWHAAMGDVELGPIY